MEKIVASVPGDPKESPAPKSSEPSHWVKVYAWRSDGTELYGHASLQTSSNSEHNYMSHWPKGLTQDQIDSGRREKPGSSVNDTSEFKKTLLDDKKAEGGGPDFVVKIKVTEKQLKNIEKYIEQRKETHATWNGLDNCTDAVVKTLKAGGIANYKLKFNRGIFDIASTPIELIEKIKHDAKTRNDFEILRDENTHLNKDPDSIKKFSGLDSSVPTQTVPEQILAKFGHAHKGITTEPLKNVLPEWAWEKLGYKVPDKAEGVQVRHQGEGGMLVVRMYHLAELNIAPHALAVANLRAENYYRKGVNSEAEARHVPSPFPERNNGNELGS